MIEGKLTVDIKFALIKDIEYQPENFQYLILLFGDEKPFYISTATYADIEVGDVYIEYSNGGIEIMKSAEFNTRYISNKKE